MGNGHVLRLEVAEFIDANRWRWRLLNTGGTLLADHTVQLNTAAPHYAALFDLQGYLAYYAAADRRLEEEARLMEQVGQWVGEQVLGPVGTAILGCGTPVTVRVVVPPIAAGLLYLPLELAHARGRPLALQDVSLVFEVEGEAPPIVPAPVGDRLRVLAVFGLPTDFSALALRRERYELERLMWRIAQTRRRAIELRVLQYGVTRERLREVMEEGGGWDVLHFSGHGGEAVLLLERADGTADPVTAEEFQELVRPARGRLKLAVLSACLSAAATIEETLQWLGIGQGPTGVSAESGAPAPADRIAAMPAVARGLVRDLDCAVLAMRYNVGDDFAIALGEQLYDGMLGKGQALTRALQLALPKALGTQPATGIPPVSVAAPALFGRRAVDLNLDVPAGTFSDPSRASLAYFPDEAERFVGRVGPLARAGAALAQESGKTGVLFHGMAGGGKTACALELAYRHRERRFPECVWYKAPDEDGDIPTALVNLALAMERQLQDFEMVHVVDRAEQFEDWLPRLTEVLEERSILIVLDNLESLLTPSGDWRDERWHRLVVALLAHRGFSRTVLTSRIRPAELDESRLQTEAVHSLSLQESALLARELPNLGGLLRGETTAGLARGRALVHRALEVVQGHPKLIELAEGQAVDPEALAGHLERAAEAWHGAKGRLQAFFETGESLLGAEEFLDALAGWTRAVVAALPGASRDLFCFLCALEEEDRQSAMAGAAWPEVWRELGRPGEAPEVSTSFAPVEAAGLARRPVATVDAIVYDIHASIADTGRKDAGRAFRRVVDEMMGDAWYGVAVRAAKGERVESAGALVHAGLTAAPYLLRTQQWQKACALLERVIVGDDSPQTVAKAVQFLRLLVAAAPDTKHGRHAAIIMANALANTPSWPQAESELRAAIKQAEAEGDFPAALLALAGLRRLLGQTGRMEEALSLSDQTKYYTQQEGLGLWTELLHEASDLQLLVALGRYEEVIGRAGDLLDKMNANNGESPGDALVPTWSVYESVLNAKCAAALFLGRWGQALAANAEIERRQLARGAPALEVALTRLDGCLPLFKSGQCQEAHVLLDACRAKIEASDDVGALERLYSALGQDEMALGHADVAAGFVQASLRYGYRMGDPYAIASSHANLARCLAGAGTPLQDALAHSLAAAVLFHQIGAAGVLSRVVAEVANVFRVAPGTMPPASFDDLCRVVEQVEGIYFRDLVGRVPRRTKDGEEALHTVLKMAWEIPDRGT